MKLPRLELGDLRDCKRIVAVLEANGFIASIIDAYNLWSAIVRARYGAQWMTLPKSDKELWDMLSWGVNPLLTIEDE